MVTIIISIISACVAGCAFWGCREKTKHLQEQIDKLQEIEFKISFQCDVQKRAILNVSKPNEYEQQGIKMPDYDTND